MDEVGKPGFTDTRTPGRAVTNEGPEQLDAEIHDLKRRVEVAVRRHCPGWLSTQADDIAQTVLTRLVDRINKSEGGRTFSTIYLEKAAYGTMVDEIRRLSRRREETAGAGYVLDRAESTEFGPDRRAMSRDIAVGVRDCVARLARPRRLAVTLYLQGCRVPETAGMLGWSRKRVENLVYRGLADLRRCLLGKGLEP